MRTELVKIKPPQRVLGNLITLLIVCCALLSLAGSVLATPLPGTPVTMVMPIPTDYKMHNVPLPAGTWTVAAITKQGADNYDNDGNSKFSAEGVFLGISLVRRYERAVSGLILIRAQIKTSINAIDPTLCVNYEDSLHANRYGMTGIVNRCLEVKALSITSDNTSELVRKTRDWLTAAGISMPLNLVGFQHAEFEQSNTYLDFSYYLDPVLYGFTTDGALGRSAWAKGVVARDINKIAFKTALISYAQRYATTLHDAFEGRGAASALTLQPFVFNGSDNSLPAQGSRQSPENQSPSGRLSELKDLCKSIGFTDGTVAMQDCVKELLLR